MKHLSKIILISIIMGSFFSACKKQDINQGIENQEETIVRFVDGDLEFKSLFFEATSPDETVDVLDIRRDAINEAELNRSNTVIIKADQTLLDQYNADNGTEFEFFSDYQFTGNSIPFDGSNWTAAFAPGDFAKLITINFNPSNLDLSKQYAMAFSITDGGGLTTSRDHLIVQIGVRNDYDADYHSSGVFHHPTAGDRDIDEDKHLVTTGPNSVKCDLGDLGSSGYQMILTINPDNSVTIAPAGATPDIDQSWGPNYYDPASKTFHLWYSYNTAAPRVIEETLVRL